MKKHATGNGSSQCVLCADGFGMLGASSVSCLDCHKVSRDFLVLVDARPTIAAVLLVRVQ